MGLSLLLEILQITCLSHQNFKRGILNLNHRCYYVMLAIGKLQKNNIFFSLLVLNLAERKEMKEIFEIYLIVTEIIKRVNKHYQRIYCVFDE